MAFRSKAHRSKMRDLLARGKIKKAHYDEMEKGTPEFLPDRLDDEEADSAAPKKRKHSPFW